MTESDDLAAAARMMRKWASLGGKKRAQSLSAARRKAIARKAGMAKKKKRTKRPLPPGTLGEGI